uniref:Uncharacterized protein n=1 Tax=Arundo donax TaxID=35708 RepID=A0A0A9GAD6_ARUDO
MVWGLSKSSKCQNVTDRFSKFGIYKGICNNRTPLQCKWNNNKCWRNDMYMKAENINV